MLVHGQTLAATRTSNPPLSKSLVVVPSVAVNPLPPTTDFLEKLLYLVKHVLDSVPEATEYDRLAIFEGHPGDFDIPDLGVDDLWEEELNKVLKSALGWGDEENMENIIQQEKKGLDGLANFVKHFIVKRGVQMALLEGKLVCLIDTLEQK